MKECEHDNWDDYAEECDDCGLALADMTQMYTDCSYCGWFGIPIIDDGAPDECDGCILDRLNLCRKANDKAGYSDAASDLAYFIKRQATLPDAEQRFKGQTYMALSEGEPA